MKNKRKPLALDLFCGGGGACIGMQQAGFEVVGIDIKPHKNYPSHFIQADIHNLPVSIDDFDFVWSSPPCQRFSENTKPENRLKRPDFIPYIRELLSTHKWTAIENVPNAPIRPDVVLTGDSVGLPYILRRRHFETSFLCMHPTPSTRLDKHLWREGKALCITTSLTMKSHYYPRKKLGLSGKPTLDEAKAAMGIPLEVEMNRFEIGESIPPAYSEFIAKEALRQMSMGDKR